MSTVSSLTSPYASHAKTATAAPVGNYERNAKLFGPAAATAIAVADLATEAAGSTVSFSSKALSELADAGKEAASAAGEVVTGTYHAIEKLASSVEDGVVGLEHGIVAAVNTVASDVKDMTHSVLSAVEGMADDVKDTVHSVASAVDSATTSVLTSNVVTAVPATFALLL